MVASYLLATFFLSHTLKTTPFDLDQKESVVL